MISTIACGRVDSRSLMSSLTWPRYAKGLQMHSVEKQSSFLWQAYSTISFSQEYLSGLTLGRDIGLSSSPEITLAQTPNLLRSPLSMFISTVSAMSSALWPVIILLHPSCRAPRYRACLLKTPQYVQLLVRPMTFTISSMVQPYSSWQDTISKGRPSSCWFRLTASRESSRQPLMPSSTASMQNSTPQLYFLLSLFMRCTTTVESLPPLAPIAILSPFLNSWLSRIVWCTSDSKQQKKHSWQMGCRFLGRLMKAFLYLQTSHMNLVIEQAGLLQIISISFTSPNQQSARIIQYHMIGLSLGTAKFGHIQKVQLAISKQKSTLSPPSSSYLILMC